MEGIIQLNPIPLVLFGKRLSLSFPYKLIARPHCFPLLAQRVFCALVLALASAGSNIPARIAIIATTTSNSIRVKPRAVGHRSSDESFMGSSATVTKQRTLSILLVILATRRIDSFR